MEWEEEWGGRSVERNEVGRSLEGWKDEWNGV